MRAMLEDTTAPAIYRTSGDPPFPVPNGPLPTDILPRQVTLRDRVTAATLIPFSSPTQVPLPLLAYLSDQYGREIEKGDTYPDVEALSLEAFGPYWFGVFGAIMLLGNISSIEDVHELGRQGHDWEKACIGSFYIKPNYPGRSSHICTGGFLVTDGARNRGVGRLMGETYLEWAPKLGYTYSVFNLVYETNVASCRIWDALGFKRIGRVKGAGNLSSHPGELIDGIIYGRDLGQDDDFVSEERFDKIRFYLKNSKYPNGADRAEKSRLRSAATHYKLIPAEGAESEKLMLKGKEVISDPQRQYEIARLLHHKTHGGINKTTASIAELYHWVRIKETVSQVIRNCPECSEMNKGLASNKSAFGNQRFPQPPPQDSAPAQHHHHFIPTQHNPQTNGNRDESPGTPMPFEVAQANTCQVPNLAEHPPYPQPFRMPEMPEMPQMPLDPALVNHDPHNGHSGHNGHSRLQNPSSSPFLATDRDLRSPSHRFQNLDLPIPDLPPPITRMSGEDSGMSVADERAPTVPEEFRRRLTKAGYNGATSNS